MASQLWSSKSKVSDWTESHKTYYETIADHKVSDLEVWYQKELPGIIEKQKCIRKDQFIRLIDWKNKRGKFRPALVKYAKEQDDAALQKASKEALQIFESHRDEKYMSVDVVMDAMSCLTALKGIGPATASAILSAMDSRVPFMSDDALLVCLGYRDYTVKAYTALIEALYERHALLYPNPNCDLTVKDMEACIFAASSGLKGEKRASVGKKSQQQDHGKATKRRKV